MLTAAVLTVALLLVAVSSPNAQERSNLFSKPTAERIDTRARKHRVANLCPASITEASCTDMSKTRQLDWTTESQQQASTLLQQQKQQQRQ